MKYINSNDLRKKWIGFYVDRGHVDIGRVSLLGNGTTGVLFNVAGMQPLMPYLLGQEHPSGKRLCNVQGCVRTIDIESVGDCSHVTFFEMMGSWSLGDYFKNERTKWSYELLTDIFGFDSDRIAATVFEGDESAPRDRETALYREESGIKKENIYYLPKKDNWWELERGPCGPDSEMFYITDKQPCGKNCNPGCDCGRFIEIGNDVFMQYEKVDDGKYKPLKHRNVDTGWGLERILQFLNGTGDIYTIDLFKGPIKYIEEKSGIPYKSDEETTRAMRIIADHVRTSIMLIGDDKKLIPSNVGAGYILRRLIRRSVRYSKLINLDSNDLCNIALMYIEDTYREAYPNLSAQKGYIIEELKKEVTRFQKTLHLGLKEFEKVIKDIEGKNQNIKAEDEKCDGGVMIGGRIAFRLFDTFGFPIELTIELANERGYKVDKNGFDEALKEHQIKSRVLTNVKARSGLSEINEQTIKYHTATHLLNVALKKVVGGYSHQLGSNINEARLRFDFPSERKLNKNELMQIEGMVNLWIKEGLTVKYEIMDKNEAIRIGAEHQFIEKYPDFVTVYYIGDVSIEICTGPHVNNTNELGEFKIIKEEATSNGVRRIKAVLK